MCRGWDYPWPGRARRSRSRVIANRVVEDRPERIGPRHEVLLTVPPEMPTDVLREREAHGVVALNVRRLARGVGRAVFAEADLGVGEHRGEFLEDAHPIRLEAVAVVLVVADQDVVEPLL